MFTALLIAAVVGYLLGALPFGYLVARAHGVNIFEAGSRNPGATNVRRVLGKGPGNLVFALDALKGAVAVGWTMLLPGAVTTEGESRSGTMLWNSDWARSDHGLALAVVGVVAALLGHSFSCFTHFKGGKGVATGAGGLLVLMPLVAAAGAATWAVTFSVSRYVSLASLVAGAILPLAAYLLNLPPLLIGLSVVIALFVAVRHRTNIRRLLDGTENRFGKKKEDAA